MRIDLLVLLSILLAAYGTGCAGDASNQAEGISGPLPRVFSDAATSALRRAVREGDPDGVRSALARGADADSQLRYEGAVLHQAVEVGQREIAEILIAHGADLMAKHKGRGHDTPLHIAAEKGHRGMAELLLAHGALVDARNEVSKTSLHLAALEGHVEMARVLISHRAEINAEDEWGYTPLHEAMMGERAGTDMIRLLADHGANVNAEDHFGGTALGYAVFLRDIDIVETLLGCGAKPDRVNRFDGTTVLHQSVSHGQLDIVEMFLKHGAEVNIRDADRQTPLHEAAWADGRAMTELLIARGARIDAQDKNGDTPAHVAAVNRYLELLDFLASKGADMKAKNGQGQTPAEVLRSSPAPEGVMLSAPSASPYGVIITNLRAVRDLLRSSATQFDRVWAPDKADVGRAATILKTVLAKDHPERRKGLLCGGHVLENLDRYNRQYGGFTRGEARYVICLMYMSHFGSAPYTTEFASILDGGCSVVRVVIDLAGETVVAIHPNFP